MSTEEFVEECRKKAEGFAAEMYNEAIRPYRLDSSGLVRSYLASKITLAMTEGARMALENYQATLKPAPAARGAKVPA